MLEVTDAHISYGPVTAVRGVSLKVAAGEVVGLVGGNGAGKSTLLRAISGLLKKKSGKVSFDGADITTQSPAVIVRAGISHVPEGRRIWPEMTVEENLILGGTAVRSDESMAERIKSVLVHFQEITERMSQKAGTLSGGEQQMLAIGRGLMSNPKLLILDEPSLGLAPIIVDRLKVLIQALRDSGLSILLAEQNAKLAMGVTDRAYVLAEGRVATSGAPKDLIKNADLIAAYLGETV